MILGYLSYDFQRQVLGSFTCLWTPGGSRKSPIKWGLSVLLSFCLSGCFLGIVSLVFSKLLEGARNPYEFVRDSRIFQKKLFSPKIGRMDILNKSMKYPDFLHVDTNSHKLKLDLKIWGGHDQK